MAALGEQVLGVRLLEVARADLRRGDVGRDGQHRRAGPVAIVEAVDQVDVAGSAGAGAAGELAGVLALGTRREGAGLLVAHMRPLDLAAGADRLRDGVETVSDDP